MTDNDVDTRPLEDILKALGRELEVDLALDEEGACYLDYEDDLPLAITVSDAAGLVVSANLDGALDLPPEQLAEILAEFNWMGEFTRGAALAFNPERGRFLLWRALPLVGLSYDSVLRQVEDVIRAALEVRPRLAERLSWRPEAVEGDEARATPAAAGGGLSIQV